MRQSIAIPVIQFQRAFKDAMQILDNDHKI